MLIKEMEGAQCVSASVVMTAGWNLLLSLNLVFTG
jgi:hypothetical protein